MHRSMQIITSSGGFKPTATCVEALHWIIEVIIYPWLTLSIYFDAVSKIRRSQGSSILPLRTQGCLYYLSYIVVIPSF